MGQPGRAVGQPGGPWGAEAIMVSASAIEIRLTAGGALDLHLPRTLRLVDTQQVPGFDQALEIFAAMAIHAHGRGILHCTS
jgi:hypothetical protein